MYEMMSKLQIANSLMQVKMATVSRKSPMHVCVYVMVFHVWMYVCVSVCVCL